MPNATSVRTVTTFDDGSTTDITVTAAASTQEVIQDVKVENTDGTSETFVPQQ